MSELLNSEGFGRITDLQERLDVLEVLEKFEKIQEDKISKTLDLLRALLDRITDPEERRMLMEIAKEIQKYEHQYYWFDAFDSLNKLLGGEGFSRLTNSEERRKVLKIATEIPGDVKEIKVKPSADAFHMFCMLLDGEGLKRIADSEGRLAVLDQFNEITKGINDANSKKNCWHTYRYFIDGEGFAKFTKHQERRAMLAKFFEIVKEIQKCKSNDHRTLFIFLGPMFSCEEFGRVKDFNELMGVLKLTHQSLIWAKLDGVDNLRVLINGLPLVAGTRDFSDILTKYLGKIKAASDDRAKIEAIKEAFKKIAQLADQAEARKSRENQPENGQQPAAGSKEKSVGELWMVAPIQGEGIEMVHGAKTKTVRPENRINDLQHEKGRSEIRSKALPFLPLLWWIQFKLVTSSDYATEKNFEPFYEILAGKAKEPKRTIFFLKVIWVSQAVLVTGMLNAVLYPSFLIFKMLLFSLLVFAMVLMPYCVIGSPIILMILIFGHSSAEDKWIMGGLTAFAWIMWGLASILSEKEWDYQFIGKGYQKFYEAFPGIIAAFRVKKSLQTLVRFQSRNPVFGSEKYLQTLWKVFFENFGGGRYEALKVLNHFYMWKLPENILRQVEGYAPFARREGWEALLARTAKKLRDGLEQKEVIAFFETSLNLIYQQEKARKTRGESLDSAQDGHIDDGKNHSEGDLWMKKPNLGDAASGETERSEIRAEQTDLEKYPWFQQITNSAYKNELRGETAAVYGEISFRKLDAFAMAGTAFSLYVEPVLGAVSNHAEQILILKIAREILGYADSNSAGAFKSLGELLQCKGLGQVMEHQVKMRVLDEFVGIVQAIQKETENLVGFDTHRDDAYEYLGKLFRSKGFGFSANSPEMMKILDITRLIPRYVKNCWIEFKVFGELLDGEGFGRITDSEERMGVLELILQSLKWGGVEKDDQKMDLLGDLLKYVVGTSEFSNILAKFLEEAEAAGDDQTKIEASKKAFGKIIQLGNQVKARLSRENQPENIQQSADGGNVGDLWLATPLQEAGLVSRDSTKLFSTEGRRSEIRIDSEKVTSVAKETVAVIISTGTVSIEKAEKVAHGIEGILNIMPVDRFAEILRAEAMRQLDRLGKSVVVLETPLVDRELAEKAVSYFIERFTSETFKGNLAMAFDVNAGPNFQEALFRMRSAIGLAVFPKALAKTLDPKILRAMPHQIVKNFKDIKLPLVFENNKAVPVVENEAGGSSAGNPGLFGVQVEATDIRGEPFLEVVEKAVQITSGLLVAGRIQNASDLKNPVKAEEMRAMLLKQLFDKQGVANVISLRNGKIFVNRAMLRDFITQYLAIQTIKQSA